MMGAADGWSDPDCPLSVPVVQAGSLCGRRIIEYERERVTRLAA
jgi:hypothetical protein